MDHGQTAGWFNSKTAQRIFSLRASLEKCASSLESIQRPCYCFHTSVSILWSQPLSLCFVSGEKVRSPAHFVTFPWISCLEPQAERKQPWAMVTSLIAKQRQVWRWVAGGGVGGRREEAGGGCMALDAWWTWQCSAVWTELLWTCCRHTHSCLQGQRSLNCLGEECVMEMKQSPYC